MRGRLTIILFVVVFAGFGCARVQSVTREDVSLSIGTTYDQWLYQGTAEGRHRFVVRSVRLEGEREVVDEREVAIAAADLPLRSTMSFTVDRARWVEFFSRLDPSREVTGGMRVSRIRRSLEYIPAPFGDDTVGTAVPTLGPGSESSP